MAPCPISVPFADLNPLDALFALTDPPAAAGCQIMGTTTPGPITAILYIAGFIAAALLIVRTLALLASGLRISGGLQAGVVYLLLAWILPISWSVSLAALGAAAIPLSLVWLALRIRHGYRSAKEHQAARRHLSQHYTTWRPEIPE